MYEQRLPQLVDSNINIDFIWPILKRAGYEFDEDGLLQAVHDNSSKRLVHYAVIGLSKLGTVKSIPVLKELLYYPNEDIRTTAVTTIGKIAGSKETKLYASLLDDPKYRDKDYPMAVIWEVGTKDALSAVIRYAEKVITGKIRLREPHDYGYIFEYLTKYPSEETSKVVERLKHIREKVTLE